MGKQGQESKRERQQLENRQIFITFTFMNLQVYFYFLLLSSSSSSPPPPPPPPPPCSCSSCSCSCSCSSHFYCPRPSCSSNGRHPDLRHIHRRKYFCFTLLIPVLQAYRIRRKICLHLFTFSHIQECFTRIRKYVIYFVSTVCGKP